jgi:Ca-activated chloride channel family protein
MKSKTLFTTLTMIGFASIVTLSSFYKTTNQTEDKPDKDETVSYKSNSKQTTQLGNLTLSTAFENDYYTNNNREGNIYVELKANKYIGNHETHTPLNISVVIDRSGSMAGDKMQNAKKAAKYIVDQLSGDDYLSVVIYDGEITLLQPTIAVANKQSIKNKIDAITDRGGTNLMGGAMKGYEEVKRFYKSGYINRVLLLSDGQANEGITDPKQIEKIIRTQNKENGISISTFGLGNDYNEDLMTAMAETGTGNYYFINDAEKIASIFKKELNGLMEVVAQNTTLTITVPDFVNIEKVYGYKYDQVGNQLTIHVHDIFSEETKGLLIKYRIQNGNNSAVKFIAKANYVDALNREKKSLATSNKASFTNQLSVYNDYFNEWASAQVALYVSNEKLEVAMKEVDKGNYQQARVIVQENTIYMSKKSKLIEKSPELKRATENNNAYDENIKNVESMAEADVKYLQKSTKSENYMIRNKR